MSIRIQARLFVVGCPRSGTTLLQSMLAAHPQIVSFPESHFFRHLEPARWWPWLMGFTQRPLPPCVDRFLSEVGHPEWRNRFPRGPWPRWHWARAVTGLLDQLANERQAPIWIEKTPGHVFHIPVIQRLIPDAKFLHLIRDGREVVASLYHVGQQYPDAWPGQQDLDQCINLWNRAVLSSRRFVTRSDHLVLQFETLLAQPEDVLRNLSKFLNIEFSPAMFEQRHGAIKTIVQSDEGWKDSISATIDKDRPSRFQRLFDTKQQAYIRQRLVDASWIND